MPHFLGSLREVGSITPQRDPHQGAPVQRIAFGGAQPGQKQLSYAQSLQFAAEIIPGHKSSSGKLASAIPSA
jgi:hypothetical protein